MSQYFYPFLSSLDRNGKLFEDCVNKFFTHDPKWSRERILDALDVLHYDAFLCVGAEDNSKMVGAIAFNPEGNIVKAFLIYVSPEFRGRGVAPVMGAEFLIWAIKNGFNNAQVGLGNSEKAVAILKSVSDKRHLLREYVSWVKITPETGAVVLRPYRADQKPATVI